MKKIIYILLAFFIASDTLAQGLHFTQYYNAPILLNPANTGLHSNADWRVGSQYRSQWTTVVPYNTFSVFGDAGFLKGDQEETGTWAGAGFALWRDVAGDGKLALTKMQGNMAYHIRFDENNVFSFGMNAAYCQRSVDISRLTFETQWDEFVFNPDIPNGEPIQNQKTSFVDLGLGINYSYASNSNFLLKISLAAMHLNRPKETFFGSVNRLGLRPIANVDLYYKLNNSIVVNPSVYFTMQKKASELTAGTLVNINVSGSEINVSGNEFILGSYFRLNDAIIGVAGYKWKEHRLMISYDHTISGFSKANRGVGAFELSLILQGRWQKDNAPQTFSCPRF